jgi:hypothetical protein
MLNKDILLKGCRAEVVAPTKKGYKRKTGTVLQNDPAAHSPQETTFHRKLPPLKPT